MPKKTNWIFRQYFISLFIILTFTTLSCQGSPTPVPLSAPPLIIPQPPELDAKAYLLMDAYSGKVLAEKNMKTKLPPASLTKLMTLYVTSETLAQGQIHLNDQVLISRKAWSRGGSRMFLEENSKVSLNQLVEGIIVASGNDACVAIAQYIGGNEEAFTQLMNQAAQQLGMKNSHFVDSTGLPKPEHYSTAYDLALLTRNIIIKFPQYYDWYKQKWITYNKIRQPNRNRLLWRDPTVDGLKTGHTNAAGYCLIASSLKNGMRLISVVMGASSDEARSNGSQALLNWGFRFYKTYKLFSANTKITTARVWFGKKNKIDLGLTNDLYVTIPRGQYKSLKASLDLSPKLEAPIVKGRNYGILRISLNDKLIEKVPLTALNDDTKSNLLARLVDHVKLFFTNLI